MYGDFLRIPAVRCATSGRRTNLSHHYTHHVLLMALIPVICAFIGTTQFGWRASDQPAIMLSLSTAFTLAVFFYALMLVGVAVMGRVIWWMARDYPQRPSLASCRVFAGYVATPMFLSGLVALYPLVWLCALVGTLALVYTGYLLFVGIPLFLSIDREESLRFQVPPWLSVCWSLKCYWR